MTVLPLLAVSVTFACAAVPSHDVSFATRYDQIIRDYIADMQRTEGDTGAARKALAERDDKLKRLLAEAETIDLSRIDLEDQIAIACTAELLRDFEKTIARCERIVHFWPSDERAYFPLVRSLLNTKQLEKADAAVQVAFRRCPKSSSVRSMYLMLHLAFDQNGQPHRAAAHIASFVEYQAERITDSPEVADSFGGRVDMMIVAFKKVEQSDQIADKLKGHLRTVEAKVRVAAATLDAASAAREELVKRLHAIESREN